MGIAELESGAVGMSFVTYGELRFGAEKSRDRDAAVTVLERLRELIPVVGPDARLGEHYGAIRAHLERSGTPIGNNDLWIAAHALATDVTLVTNNTREFSRVPGLELENWAQ